MHGLGSKVSTGKPEWDHDGVQGRSGVLDAPVNPPVLGVGLFNDVMAGLVGFDRYNLLANLFLFSS